MRLWGGGGEEEKNGATPQPVIGFRTARSTSACDKTKRKHREGMRVRVRGGQDICDSCKKTKLNLNRGGRGYSHVCAFVT